jgi:leader peptidase (prepilin peptidase)/N-methyltransferase
VAQQAPILTGTGKWMEPDMYPAVLSFLLGLVLGSFMNVCIYRIPEKKSIVNPGSHCRTCSAALPWYDNIPLLSYLILRGRCRHCRAPIGFRYPLVEGLAGALSLALFLRHGPGPLYIHQLVFSLFLVVISFIDLDHMIIPDVLSIPGILIGIPASFLVPHVSPLDSLIGIIAGGGAFYIIAYGYSLLTGKDGMGGGDIKLIAMIGAWMGWRPLPFVILVSALAGTLIGGIFIVASGKGLRTRIPFGPFLALGALVYLFFGNEIIRFYLRFLQG